MSDMEQIKKVMSYIVGFHVGGQMLPQMLPGVKADDLMGDMIEEYFITVNNRNVGSSMSLVMLVLILITTLLLRSMNPVKGERA